ncbi:MAG: prolyl oligopeptidase family serine peptidase [Mucilaginibacter polytrichastri]|nr:prolyl oligopeptidase family serine peptidase [Mucilaginibacter polytrichastri]
MKKYAFTALVLATLGFAGCQKGDNVAPASSEKTNSVSGVTENPPASAIKLNTSAFVFKKDTEGQTAHNLEKPTTSVTQYLAYLPKGYNDNPEKKWPVILYLHGSSELGNDINSIFWTYFAWKTMDKKYPYILITPQLRSGQTTWSSDDLVKVLQEVASKYSIDAERLVVTGYSLGATGAWKLAEYAPSIVAGLLPISGWGDVSKANTLKNVPIWAFHGDADQLVNPNFTINMIQAVREAGSTDAKLTIYPGKGHDVGALTYDNPDVIQWMLNREK